MAIELSGIIVDIEEGKGAGCARRTDVLEVDRKLRVGRIDRDRYCANPTRYIRVKQDEQVVLALSEVGGVSA